MPHDRLSADLSFLDEKIEFGFHSDRPSNPSSNKQTSRAHVPDV
jgi:hypothetical protein